MPLVWTSILVFLLIVFLLLIAGDMVLYESHSVIHGRPFPMQGRFYANFFIHFEVLGPLDGEIKYDPSLGLPPYLIPGSKWEDEWRKNNPKGWSKVRKRTCALFVCRCSAQTHEAFTDSFL
jgi:hypothetical protein